MTATWISADLLGTSVSFILSDIGGVSRTALAADYAVTKTLQIGGEGGFDYATLDADGKTLYLPRTSHTQVVDVASGKVLADIPNNSRSHGVALVPEVGRGFISNGGDATVQIFDLKSNQSLGKIKAADDADCIIYDPASKDVLAFCGDAHVMIAVPADVDPKDGKASASVDLGGKPEFAVSDGRGKVFVNLVDKNEVAVVDTKAMKVIAKWPVAPAAQPVGMSMDANGKRLFVGCRSQADGHHECAGWPHFGGSADWCRCRCNRVSTRDGVCKLRGRYVDGHSGNRARKV